eukprot:m.79192 g.79192  ORF g.79192 m.79192 type:complete len:388 (+) comp14511_c0_seq4:3721-4884(+)
MQSSIMSTPTADSAKATGPGNFRANASLDAELRCNTIGAADPQLTQALTTSVCKVLATVLISLSPTLNCYLGFGAQEFVKLVEAAAQLASGTPRPFNQLDVAGYLAYPVSRAIAQCHQQDTTLLEGYTKLLVDELTPILELVDSGLKEDSHHACIRQKVDTLVANLTAASSTSRLVILLVPLDGNLVDMVRRLLQKGCRVVIFGYPEQAPPILKMCLDDKTCWYLSHSTFCSASGEKNSVDQAVTAAPTCSALTTRGTDSSHATRAAPCEARMEQRKTLAPAPNSLDSLCSNQTLVQGTLEFEVAEHNKPLPNWLASNLVKVLCKISKLRSCSKWFVRHNRVVVTFGESNKRFLHRQMQWLLNLKLLRINGCAGVSHVVTHPVAQGA